ncbi:three-helix bundle dimerization domain-containing protein [Actinomadura kijaniata]|uniref:three-helix bundle dimerization domain-containing protein n=1 Tax=Actinomadura kijaniata TaxID=46161 RepID=UPI003F1B91DC
MADPGDGAAPRDEAEAGYRAVGERLTAEFSGVHPPETVARCVAAARHGAQEVAGGAPADLVEKIARRHLQVLAMVAAEKRRRAPRTTLGNTP